MTTPASPDLAAAWDALRSYDYGSPRGALMPIDNAVGQAARDRRSRKVLEHRLTAALETAGPVPAREYICARLALIGSDDCVPAVAKLLVDPALSTASRNVLEVLPSTGAGKALAKAIPRLDAALKIGAINSLGNRREPAVISALVPLLKDSNPDVAAAATAALGTIGDPRAAKALRGFFPSTAGTLRLTAADAILACADQLARAGNLGEARSLCQFIAAATDLPDRFRQAAARANPA